MVKILICVLIWMWLYKELTELWRWIYKELTEKED